MKGPDSLYHILKQLHGVHDVLVLEKNKEKRLSTAVQSKRKVQVDMFKSACDIKRVSQGHDVALSKVYPYKSATFNISNYEYNLQQ